MSASLVRGGGVLTACNPTKEHTHDWSQEYSWDDSSHYYTCSGCDQHTGTEQHVYDDDNDASCNKCGYERHIHTLVWKWEEDSNGNHWQEYSCEHHADEKLNLGKHDFGNDNICDTCGYDRTPPHTHNEVTKYNEEQHWTSYDCEEHGDEKINPQNHTFENDPEGNKCDNCGYDRNHTEHTVSDTWSHNETSHWKIYTCWHHADEQLQKGDHEWEYDSDKNKDVCKVCKYEVAHDHTRYQTGYGFDYSEHWTSYSCHPDVQEDKDVHDLTGDGICDCGLRKSYVDVYDLYVANENYKNNTQVDDFTAWYNSLKQQNVDHVGLNDAGDGLFYASDTDFTGVAHYFGERTLTVSVGEANFWFTLKVSKNDEYQTLNGKEVISIGKTDSTGKVTFAFWPVWGLSSDEVKYEIALATKAELVAIEEAPTPQPSTKTIIGNNKQIAEVNATSKTISVTFTCGSAIGIGEAAAYQANLVGYETTASVYLADEVTPGRYWLNVQGTSGLIADNAVKFWIQGTNDYGDNYIPLTVATEGTGGHGSMIIEIGENATQLVMQSGVANIGIRCSFEKLEGGNISVGKKTPLYVNPTNAEEKITYQLNIPAGDYNIAFVKPGLSSNSQYKNDDPLIQIGDAEAVAISTLKNKTMAFAGNETIVLTYDTESVVYDFEIQELKSFKLDVEESISLGKVTAPDSSKMYVFTAAEDGYYYVTTKGSKDVTISLKEEGGSSYILSSIDHSPNSDSDIFQSYFKCEKDKMYKLTFKNNMSTRDSDHPNSPVDFSTPISFTAKISEAPLHEMANGEEYTETFDTDRMVHIGITAEEEGMYVLNLKMEGKVHIEIFDGFNGAYLNKVYDSVGSLLNFGYASGGIVVPIWLNAKESKEYFLYYKKSSTDGTEYLPLTYSVTKVSAQAKSAIDDSVTFSDENRYVYYAFNSGDNESATMNITASGEDDVRFIHIWQIVDGGIATPVRTASGQALSSIQQSVALEKNKTYHFIVAYLGETYPENPVTIQMGKSLAQSVVSRPFGRYEHLLTWTEVENAEEYELWESLTGNTSDKNGTYNLVATLHKGDILQYQIPLTSSRFYYVIAKDTDGEYLSSRSEIVSSSGTGASGISTYGTLTLTINKPADYEGLVLVGIYYNSSTAYGALMVQLVKGQTSQQAEIFTGTLSKSTYTYSVKITPLKEDYVADGPSISAITTKDGTTTGTVSILQAGTIDVTIKLPAHFEGSTNPLEFFALDKTTNKRYSTSNVNIPASEEESTYVVQIKNILGYTEDHEYEISIGNIYLPQGNRLEQEKVITTIDKTTHKGSCEMVVLQRAKVTIKLNLPENFVGGSYEFLCNGYLDEAKSKQMSIRFSPDIPAGQSTYEQVIYAFWADEAYVTLKQNSSDSDWSANGYYDGGKEVKVLTNTAEATLEFTIQQRMDIAVTVNPVEGHAGETVQVRVSAKGASISSSKNVTLGNEPVTEHLYIVSGYDGYSVSGPALSTSREFFYTGSVDVVKDPQNQYKGTASLSAKFAYIIQYTMPKASASSCYGVPTVSLFKDGVRLNDQATGRGFGKTASFYIDYDPNATYMLVATTLNLNSKYRGNYVGSKIVTFEEGSRTTKVELEFATPNTTYEFTIEDIPQELITSESTANVWLRNYACGTTGDYSSSNGVVSASVNFKNAKDGKLTGTLQFLKTDDASFHMEGLDLTNLFSKTLATSTNYIKKYYAEQDGEVTFGADGKYHVTLKIKESLNVGVKIEGLDNSTSTPEFDIKVVVSDKAGKAVGTYSLKVPANASADDVKDAVISLIKWEDGYTAAISSTTTNSAYTVDAEGKFNNDGDTYSLTIKVNKRVPVKVTLPNLENSTDYVAFDIDLKVNDSDGLQLVSYKFNVPKNSNSDVEYYIYLDKWADNYQAVVSSSTADNAWTIVDALFSTDGSGKHILTINVTKKPTFKVEIPNLSSDLPTDADSFRLTFTVQDGEGTAKETFTVTVPKNAKADEFAAYIYPKEWQSGWKIEVSGTSNQYLIEGVTVGSALESGVYPLTVNIKTKEIVKVLLDGLFEKTPVDAFNISIFVYNNAEKSKSICSNYISVPANAQDGEYCAWMYFDEWSTTLYPSFSITGSTIPYRDDSTTATFADDGGQHVMTVHLGKKVVTKVLIPGFEQGWATSSFAMYLYIREGDSTSNAKSIYLSISAAAQKTDYVNNDIWDADWKDNYKYTVDAKQYGGYMVKDCTWTTDEDGVKIVTINVEKAQKIRFTIPNLDSSLKSPQFNFKAVIYNAEHTSTGTYSTSVSANQGNDFFYDCFPSKWEEGYTIEVTLTVSSGGATSYPYIFTGATCTVGVNKDDQHILDCVVDLKLKPIVKVMVEGLDESGILSAKTYTVDIKNAEGTSIKTLSLTMSAGQKNGLLTTTFFEAWAANGMTAEVTSTTTATMQYRIVKCTLADDENGEHVLTLTMQKRIAVTYSITVPASLTEGASKSLKLQILYGETKVLEQSVTVSSNTTQTTGTFYVDELENTYTAVLATELDGYKIECKLTVSEDGGVKSGNIVVTVTEEA